MDDLQVAQILAAIHADVEHAVFTVQQTHYKEQLDTAWANLVAAGEWSSVHKADLEAAIANLQMLVSGTWTALVDPSTGMLEIVQWETPVASCTASVRAVSVEPSGRVAAYIAGEVSTCTLADVPLAAHVSDTGREGWPRRLG